MDNNQTVTHKKHSYKNPRRINMPSKETKNIIEEFISNDIPYTKFKYDNVIYKIGDCMFIKDSNDTFSIGKLVKIISANGIKSLPFWPTIKVKWFYKKKEINWEKNGITSSFYDSISEYEVFKSKHYDIIFIESVLCKCTVLPIQEYQIQKENSDLIFFTRARYDPLTQIITPPIDQWERSCSCNAPVNPDLLYIKCDQCDNWFHPTCEGLSNEEAKIINEFYCQKCIQSKKKLINGLNPHDCLTK